MSLQTFVDTEEWVPVHTLPGFESCIEYHINRDGEVKSTKGGRDRLLKPVKIKNGYMKVNLQQRLGQKGEKQTYVHVLVAFAFLGNPPTPYGKNKGNSVVDHIDENKQNNHVSNLRWVTMAENINKFAYGKFQKKILTPTQELEREERKKFKAKMRMRKWRQKKKLSKLNNNAEVSDGRAHSAELGED